jgi:predicted alpha/beta-fold hydrolase
MSRGQGAAGVRFQPAAFRPAWWLPGAHAQTIAGRLLRDRHASYLRRERVDTPDGDFLDLDFTPGASPGEPVVLLLHGLEGSARRGYALNAYRGLAARGIGAVGLNFRSCGGEPNRLARSYHSGETGDLDFVLDWLRDRLPASPLAVIGFSLGGNVLLKWLGEQRDAALDRVVACAAVSVPFDLAECERALDGTTMGRFYVRRFLGTLIGKIEAKANIIGNHIDIDRVRAARSFRAFDDAATAPLHGFPDAAEYYARSSSAPLLPFVRVPTLVLHAEDDPFMPGSRAPFDVLHRNPVLQPVITRHGGHVGFVSGQAWSPRYWAEREAARYLADCLHAYAGDGAHP